MLLLASIALTACSDAKSEDTASNLIINKDKSIISTVKEDFNEPYYDVNELKEMINSDIAEYNKTHDAAISSKEPVLEEGVVSLELTYKTSEDYSIFNNESLFTGNPSDALLKGYSLDVILTDISDPTKTIAGVDIKGMTDNTILITDYIDNIHLPSKALYASDNVVVSDNGKTVKRNDTSDKPVFVIY